MTETNDKQQEQAVAAHKQGGTQRQQEGVQTPVSNQMGSLRPCPKDCRRCSWQQQICCASMLSFQSFDVMNSIIQRLDIQSQRITDLESKLSAIQSSEGELLSPLPFQDDLFAGQE